MQLLSPKKPLELLHALAAQHTVSMLTNAVHNQPRQSLRPGLQQQRSNPTSGSKLAGSLVGSKSRQCMQVSARSLMLFATGCHAEACSQAPSSSGQPCLWQQASSGTGRQGESGAAHASSASSCDTQQTGPHATVHRVSI